MFDGMAAGRRTVAAADAAHAWVGQAQRALRRAIAEVDRTDGWRGEGARDLTHWVSMRYGISTWKATRWVGAARALSRLPRVSEALCSGELSLDKVLELCRFATPQSEERLVRWAKEVSVASVRHRGDREARASREELVEAERSRFLGVVAHRGGKAARAGGRAAGRPGGGRDPGDRADGRAPPDDARGRGTRRGPSPPGRCSRGALLGEDGHRSDPDRATVVVHVDAGGAELEHGPAIAPEVARRLACDARVQVLTEDPAGNLLHVSPITRTPPAWMVRQVRYRDRGCRFPGCGTRAFTQAHHIRWWRHGGRTEVDNLVLLCSFHHRLVHEHGWQVRREPDGEVRWFRPDGTGYRAGPSPWVRPEDDLDDRTELTALG